MARGRPGGGVSSIRAIAASSLAFLRALRAGRADPLARPRQQPAGARRRHARRGHLHARRARSRSSAAARRTCYVRGRRALRAPRRQCIKWGLGPAEFFAGIPGTLGGALAMNAGAFGGETWPRVVSVDTIDRARQRARRARRARISGRLSPRRAAGAGRVVPRRDAQLRAAGPARTETQMRELLAQAQGNAADRRVELRLGVHQSAGRSRRAPHRGGGPQGLSHRRRHRCPPSTRISSSTTARPRAADIEQLIAHVQDDGGARSTACAARLKSASSGRAA